MRSLLAVEVGGQQTTATHPLMEWNISLYSSSLRLILVEKETRVIQHRSATGAELHEGRTKSWVCSHPEDRVRPEETLKPGRWAMSLTLTLTLYLTLTQP